MSFKPYSATERLRRNSARSTTGCWNWTGALNPNGYASLKFKGQIVMAHRLSYETYVSPIPEGMQIDHLCRNTRCIHPDHLEAVTPRVNSLRSTSFAAKNARKEACKNGHPFTPENTYRWGNDGRSIPARLCRVCRADAERRRRRRVSAATAVAGLTLALLAAPAVADHGQEQDGCTHGATGKPCRPDPQPTNGKDCERHGNHGGINEAHCAGSPSPTTTGSTPSPSSTPSATTNPPSSSTTTSTTPSAPPSTDSSTSVPSVTASTTRPATHTAKPPRPAPATTPNGRTPTPTSSQPPPNDSSTGELAHTGADLSDGAAIGIFALLVGLLLWAFTRTNGDHE